MNNKIVFLFIFLLASASLANANEKANSLAAASKTESLLVVSDRGNKIRQLDGYSVQNNQLVLDGVENFRSKIEKQVAGSINKISSRASCEIRSLFSSQEGSWPFEVFAKNNLFPVLAKFQKSHPRAIWLRNGKLTLQNLHKCISNSKVLQKKGARYILKYPLIIDVGGLLTLNNDDLQIAGETGAAIIVLGNLEVTSSIVSSSPKLQSLDTLVKPANGSFIVGWAGSHISLKNAKINGLGRKGHLTTGITLAKNNNAKPSYKKALLLVDNVEFNDGLIPLNLNFSNAVISNSTFTGYSESTFIAKYSSTLLDSNKFEASTLSDTLRGQFSNQIYALNNEITKSGGHAIKLDNTEKQVLLSNNIYGNNGNGIAIELHKKQSENQKITIVNNQILDNLGSGISLSNTDEALVFDNTLSKNGLYGLTWFSYLNDEQHTAQANLSGLSVFDNKLHQNSAGAMKAEGHGLLSFSNNSYRAMPPAHTFFSGDIRQFQSLLIKNEQKLINQNKTVDVILK